MFSQDEGYKFVLKGSKKECDGEVCFRRHTFSFKSKKNHTYIAEVDEFDDFSLCIIKFHLKAHRFSNKKFQLLTRFNEPVGLITTCINIMMSFYDKNPYFSFGFIGMNSENESERETKRFQVYQKVMKRVFSPVKFLHFEHKPKSAYLLLNRDSVEINPTLIHDIENFFNKHYLLGTQFQ